MKKCIKSLSFLSVGLIATLLVISGCYYDKEDLLYPGTFVCDTTQAKYSSTVLPILTASCYSCHAGGFPSGGIRLDNYNDLRVHALSGKLYGAISHSNGFTPMPQSGPKLSDCKIQAIKRWIDEGAQNN